MRRTALSMRLAAGEQRQRIEIALHRQILRQLLRGPERIDRLVEAERVDPGLARISGELAARAFRESR